MSYPPPRYLGSDGEVSAAYRPANHAPDLGYSSGNTVHYLATGATTNGQFGLYRWEMGPERSGPDPRCAPREAYFENLPGLADKSPEERDAFFLEHDTFWL